MVKKAIKQIIAIGGGGFGRKPGEGIIEKYILEQSHVTCPKICFIPTATGDDEAYKVNFYSTFSKLNCLPTHLDFFKRTPNLKKLIEKQNIIFVGGGNTKSMLAVWREWELNTILKKAYNKGVIMCGVSAGAICWFDKGITDSWSDSLKVMDCLGFVKGICCPHYDEEPERKPSLHKFLNKKIIESCYAIEGGCALHIKGGKPLVSVAFEKNKNSYFVKYKQGKIKETEYFKKNIF